MDNLTAVYIDGSLGDTELQMKYAEHYLKENFSNGIDLVIREIDAKFAGNRFRWLLEQRNTFHTLVIPSRVTLGSDHMSVLSTLETFSRNQGKRAKLVIADMGIAVTEGYGAFALDALYAVEDLQSAVRDNVLGSARAKNSWSVWDKNPDTVERFLSGILRCGICGTHAMPGVIDGSAVYRCRSKRCLPIEAERVELEALSCAQGVSKQGSPVRVGKEVLINDEREGVITTSWVYEKTLNFFASQDEIFQKLTARHYFSDVVYDGSRLHYLGAGQEMQERLDRWMSSSH